MCIKNGILRVLFSGRSFIDFQGGALRAPPRENRPLPDVGFERVNLGNTKRGPKFYVSPSNVDLVNLIASLKGFGAAR